MGWSAGLAHWVDTADRTAYVSVAFSWRLEDARQIATVLRDTGYHVRAGGPAVWAQPKALAAVAAIGGAIPEAVTHHNPEATFASRGCPVNCTFCVVPRMEGLAFTLLPEFTPRPILCDNNLSALPPEYQAHIIEKYQRSGVALLDANSGFEPRAFDEGTYARWRAVLRGPWRFAFDELEETEDVRRMMAILRPVRARMKRVYVLIGNEPFAACMERITRVIEWGGEPYCQPFLALNAARRTHYKIAHDWTPERLRDVARWVNRYVWRRVKFEDYRYVTSDADRAALRAQSRGGTHAT